MKNILYIFILFSFISCSKKEDIYLENITVEEAIPQRIEEKIGKIYTTNISCNEPCRIFYESSNKVIREIKSNLTIVDTLNDGNFIKSVLQGMENNNMFIEVSNKISCHSQDSIVALYYKISFDL